MPDFSKLNSADKFVLIGMQQNLVRFVLLYNQRFNCELQVDFQMYAAGVKHSYPIVFVE